MLYRHISQLSLRLGFILLASWQPLLACVAATEASPPSHIQSREFAIVVLPDTQHYAQYNPAGFYAQTNWIARHVRDKNIVFVSQLGDIVEIWDDESEWRVASEAFAKLDGVVPYGISPGNHDIGPDNADPFFPIYFPASRITEPALSVRELTSEFMPVPQVGTFDDRNTYHIFSTGTSNFIAFNLEFCPSNEAVTWVDTTLKRFPTYTAIISTHSFLNSQGQRESDAASCSAYHSQFHNSGQEIWHKLIVEGQNTNILLFLSGHDITSSTGAAHRTDYVDGRPIHQLLSNYQLFPNGGDGYLRLMTFEPDKRVIHVSTYSPALNTQLADPTNDFYLDLPKP